MCDSFGKHMLDQSHLNFHPETPLQKISVPRKVFFCHTTLFLTCTTSIFVNMDHFIDTKQANPTKKQAKLRHTKRLTNTQTQKNRLRLKMLTLKRMANFLPFTRRP